MKLNNDLTKILKKEHEEKWVALSKDQTSVVDYAERLSQLRERVGEQAEVTYMKVLASDTVYGF